MNVIIVLTMIFLILSLKKFSSTKIMFVSKSMQSESDFAFNDKLILIVAYCHFLKSYSIFIFLFTLTLNRIKNTETFDLSFISFEYVLTEAIENLVKFYIKDLKHIRRCLCK